MLRGREQLTSDGGHLKAPVLETNKSDACGGYVLTLRHPAMEPSLSISDEYEPQLGRDLRR
jgi:hypothetical protein